MPELPYPRGPKSLCGHRWTNQFGELLHRDNQSGVGVGKGILTERAIRLITSGAFGLVLERDTHRRPLQPVWRCQKALRGSDDMNEFFVSKLWALVSALAVLGVVVHQHQRGGPCFRRTVQGGCFPRI